MIEIRTETRTPDGAADGFLFRPEGNGPFPGVIFLPDIKGIRNSMHEMANHLASKGYAVLLPNIFYRTSKPPVITFPFKMGEERSMQRLRELTEPLTPEAVARDGSAYVDFLGKLEVVNRGPVGIVGYCLSGAMAMRIAAARPDKIAAVASFHGGRLFTDAPDSPHLLLPEIKARLYFGHAPNDKSMPQESIGKLNRALQESGRQYESEIYEGTRHGWTIPDRDSPVYNEPQAERAFTKLTHLFAETVQPKSITASRR